MIVKWIKERVFGIQENDDHAYILAETEIVKSAQNGFTFDALTGQSKHQVPHGRPIPVDQHPNVKEAWTKAIRVTGQEASHQIANALHAVEKGVDHSIERVEEAYDTVKDAAKQLGHEGIQKGKDVAHGISQGVKHIGDQAQHGADTVKQIGQVGVEKSKQALGNTVEGIHHVGESIQHAGAAVKDSIEEGIHHTEEIILESTKDRVKRGWSGLVNIVYEGFSKIAGIVNSTSNAITSTLSWPARPVSRVSPTKQPTYTTAVTKHPLPTSPVVTVHRWGQQHDLGIWDTGINRIEKEQVVLAGAPPPMIIHREATVNVAPVTPTTATLPSNEPTPTLENGGIAMETEQPVLGPLPSLYLLIFTIVYFILARRLWQERRITGVYVGDGSYEMAREAARIEVKNQSTTQPTHGNHVGDPPRTPPRSSPISGGKGDTTAVPSMIIPASQDKNRHYFRQLARLRKTVEALSSYLASAIVAQVLILFLDLAKGPYWMIHLIGIGSLFTSWLNIEGGILSADVGGDNRVAANVIYVGIVGLGFASLLMIQ